MPRPLTCTRCGHQVAISEDALSLIEWGPAVVGDDGVVRLQYPDPHDGYQEVTHGGATLRTRACCLNEECGHQWTLRRRFDPIT